MTKAEADAAVQMLNDASDAYDRALRRVSEDTGVNMLRWINQHSDTNANAKIAIRARTDKETEQ